MMAQSIILPDGPLFMADRGWKTPAGDFKIQVVPFGCKKKARLSRRSSPPSSPATDLLKEPLIHGTTPQCDLESTRPMQYQKASSTPTQSFPFVNVTSSFGDRDPEARR